MEGNIQKNSNEERNLQPPGAVFALATPPHLTSILGFLRPKPGLWYPHQTSIATHPQLKTQVIVQNREGGSIQCGHIGEKNHKGIWESVSPSSGVQAWGSGMQRTRDRLSQAVWSVWSCPPWTRLTTALFCPVNCSGLSLPGKGCLQGGHQAFSMGLLGKKNYLWPKDWAPKNALLLPGWQFLVGSCEVSFLLPSLLCYNV